LLEGIDEGFPLQTQAEAILVNVVRLELFLNGLPDHPVHVSGLGG
jgi:hypothetical protein